MAATTARPSDTKENAFIDVLTTASIAPVSPLLFSGFLEHLGRCIYGGILPASRTTFPYTPRKPCPEVEFTATPSDLIDERGFRKDVLGVLRDELAVPLVRWPGGNYVSSYHWQDGIGPQSERKRRPELAWGGEESNEFGTDEFVAWCREGKIEPYIVLNMGTGTLEEALRWIEYCNGTGDTHFANLRRKNTGYDEPHNIKYWGLGNEVWGEWQVGQQTPEAYATKARQWAHAIRLVDPSVILVVCGQTGIDPWDGVILDTLVDKVDMTSLHLYSGFGPRDRSQVEKEYARSVYGPDAAEYSIEVCRGLINKARFAKNVSKPITIAFDEYGVWDETVGTPENGLQQHYNFSDALAMASWLNLFVRQSDIVAIACLAQSVNVIAPLLVNATGVLRQTIFWPMYLFSRYMRGGTAVQVSLSSGAYSGETLPQWLGVVAGPRRELDASASLVTLDGGRRSLRLAVVNRGETTDYANVPIRVLGVDGAEVEEVEVHELWHQDVKVRNTWEQPEVVTVQTRREKWTGHWTFRAHSFTLLVIDH